MKRNNKAFTLVEMLIVVVIIGILAAALIPRLIGAQSQARDTARVTWVNQIKNGLEVYYNDQWNYPSGLSKPSVELLSWALAWKLSDIPRDPQTTRTTKFWVAWTTSNAGYWAYSPLSWSNWTPGYWVFATTENDKKANYIWQAGITAASTDGFDQAKAMLSKCTGAVKNAATTDVSWANCNANAVDSQYAQLAAQ